MTEQKLKVYRVYPHRDSDWCVVAVARDAQEAKVIGWHTFPVREGDYIDMRVKQAKDVELPDRIRRHVGPHGFDCCQGHEDWLCGVFTFDVEDCVGCKRYDEKYAEWEKIENE